MTMSEFEHELQNAFAAQIEPADAGFSVRVARKLARREGKRWPVLAVSFAVILAAAVSGFGLVWAPVAAMLANVQAPFVGFDLGAAMDIAGWSIAQAVIGLSKISPYVLVLGATSVGAVAYAARSD